MAARELVLVPRSKFEHLLKLANGSEQNEQSGGQLDNKAEIQTLDTNLKTKDDI